MYFIDILGWMASATYLAANGLNSTKKINSDSSIYQGMNIFAGVTMILYTLHHEAYSATALNSIWALIGVITLVTRQREING